MLTFSFTVLSLFPELPVRESCIALWSFPIVGLSSSKLFSKLPPESSFSLAVWPCHSAAWGTSVVHSDRSFYVSSSLLPLPYQGNLDSKDPKDRDKEEGRMRANKAKALSSLWNLLEEKLSVDVSTMVPYKPAISKDPMLFNVYCIAYLVNVCVVQRRTCRLPWE